MRRSRASSVSADAARRWLAAPVARACPSAAPEGVEQLDRSCAAAPASQRPVAAGAASGRTRTASAHAGTGKPSNPMAQRRLRKAARRPRRRQKRPWRTQLRPGGTVGHCEARRSAGVRRSTSPRLSRLPAPDGGFDQVKQAGPTHKAVECRCRSRRRPATGGGRRRRAARRRLRRHRGRGAPSRAAASSSWRPASAPGSASSSSTSALIATRSAATRPTISSPVRPYCGWRVSRARRADSESGRRVPRSSRPCVSLPTRVHQRLRRAARALSARAGRRPHARGSALARGKSPDFLGGDPDVHGGDGIGDVAPPQLASPAQDNGTHGSPDGRGRRPQAPAGRHPGMPMPLAASTRYWRSGSGFERVHQARCAIGIKDRSAMSWSPPRGHLFGDRDEGPCRAGLRTRHCR